jgi:hypothetical protein
MTLVNPDGADQLVTADGRRAIILPGGEIHVAEPEEAKPTSWESMQMETRQMGKYLAWLRLERRIVIATITEAWALQAIAARVE